MFPSVLCYGVVLLDPRELGEDAVVAVYDGVMLDRQRPMWASVTVLGPLPTAWSRMPRVSGCVFDGVMAETCGFVSHCWISWIASALLSGRANMPGRIVSLTKPVRTTQGIPTGSSPRNNWAHQRWALWMLRCALIVCVYEQVEVRDDHGMGSRLTPLR